MLRTPWFVPATIFVVCWSLTTHGKFSASGDEPHYLMVAQSLWADGDLDVRNNYSAGESRRFGVEGLEAGPHARATNRGTLFPVHDIGVPVVLLPVYAIATAVSQLVPESLLRRFRMGQGLFAYSLISLVIIGITSAAAAVTRSALIADGATPTSASLIVLALWLSPPVLSNSFLVFPEPFALLLTACAVRIAVSDWQLDNKRVYIFFLALGLLPWVHRKYAVYAAALLVAVMWQKRSAITGVPGSKRAAALACFIAPQIALSLWTLHHWGNLGGPLMRDGAPFSLDAAKAGSLGLLVDRENGLFVWAPIYLMLPVAWAVSWRRHWIWIVPAATLYFLSAAHFQWWGGFSPAGRFLVPLVPIFALVSVDALRHSFFRVAAVVLTIPQVCVSAYGWQHARALWPRGDGNNRVLSAVLPWFGLNDGMLPSLRSSMPAFGRAAVLIVTVALLNGVIWMTVSRSLREAPEQVR